MKKGIALLTAAMLLMGLLTGCAFAAGSGLYRIGDKIEDFTVELCDGSTFTLSEACAARDLVMINIWASWCGPCRNEFPFMEKAYEQYRDRVALVCLSIDPGDTNTAIAAFMERQGLTALPMGYDAAGVGNRLVKQGYPTTVLVDKDGTYVYYECGSLPSVAAFTEMFDRFLNGGAAACALDLSPALNDRQLSLTLIPESDAAVIDSSDVFSAEDLHFEHKYDHPDYWSVMQSDILIVNYSGADPYPVMRTMLYYNGTVPAGVNAVSFILGDRTFRLTGLELHKQMGMDRDRAYEAMLILYGPDTMAFADAVIAYAEEAAANGEQDTLQATMVLHGTEDLTVTLNAEPLLDLYHVASGFKAIGGPDYAGYVGAGTPAAEQ